MRLSYSLQRDEYACALDAITGSIMATDFHAAWTRRLKRSKIFYYVALVAAVIAMLLVFPGNAEIILIVTTVMVLLQSIAKWMLDSDVWAGLGATYDSRRLQNMTASFDATRVTWSGERHTQSWEWGLLQKLHRLPKVYVLEFIGYDMLVVPRRAFSSIDEEMHWLRAVRQRLP